MKRRQWIGLICLAGFVLFLLLSPRQNIMATDVRNMYGPSSPEHWLGTDNLGRDMYSLLVEGGLRTMEVVFLSAAISFIAGTALGMVAAFWGGVLRSVIQFAADFTLIVPSFIMAMVFSALFGFRPIVAGVVFGIGNMGEYVNQAYNLAYVLKKQEFIDAERVIGLGRGRILIFHVLPNICHQLFVFLGNKAANVVVQYSGLAFIGLGTDITRPDWGTLLYQYRTYMISHPTLVIYPAAAITLLTVFFHVMFDSGSAGGEKVTLYD